MEKSIDKRLEALGILSKCLCVRIEKVENGEAHVVLSDGDQQHIDIYVASHEAELLKKAMEQSDGANS